tara:strand:+ start:968 stop:1225 length:258 start_codon:yes stop_codon:yes gene_type:complete
MVTVGGGLLVQVKVETLAQLHINDHGWIGIGRKMTEDKGCLVCLDCGSNPSSEPVEDIGSDIWVALCSVCKDWADFKYEGELDEE